MEKDKKSKRFKAAVTPQQLLELGKLPPSAVDLEEAVLGAMMLDKDCLANIIDILNQPDVFYKEAHQRIFSAIKSLFEKAEPVDILTVVQSLKKTGELEIAGGAYYVTQLTNRIASTANAEMHSRIIIEKYLNRELIRISTNSLQSSYDDTSDIFEMLDKAEQDLFSISNIFVKKNFESARVVAGKTISEIEHIRASGGTSGLPSGYKKLDAITGGWQKSDLIILAARPGVGKSAVAMQFARNAAVDYGKPVAVFSLEMSSTSLMMRLFSSEAEIPAEKIRQGQMNDAEFNLLNSKIGRLVSSPMFIDDTPALSLFEFRSKARRLKAQYDIGLIVIDYLQLMVANDGQGRSREQEVSLISRTLKAIAKELNIPIIALSQLSRETEKRIDKKGRPQLSDMRESGAIEQDADVIMFIYRPEKQGYETDDDGNSTKGVAEIIIAKHRNGKTGSEAFHFNETFARFEDNSESFSIINNSSDPFSSPSPYSAPSSEPIQEAKIIPPNENLGFDDNPGEEDWSKY